MTEIEIVNLSPEECQPNKQLRLEALLNEPQSFSSKYADALQNPDGYWQGRLQEAQTGSGAGCCSPAKATGWLA